MNVAAQILQLAKCDICKLIFETYPEIAACQVSSGIDSRECSLIFRTVLDSAEDKIGPRC